MHPEAAAFCWERSARSGAPHVSLGCYLGNWLSGNAVREETVITLKNNKCQCHVECETQPLGRIRAASLCLQQVLFPTSRMGFLAVSVKGVLGRGPAAVPGRGRCPARCFPAGSQPCF